MRNLKEKTTVELKSMALIMSRSNNAYYRNIISKIRLELSERGTFVVL